MRSIFCLESLINEPTCFKSATLSCKDLILNKKKLKSDRTKISFGVPQGSILDPSFFNVFQIFMFLFLVAFVFINNGNLHNYADDDTLHPLGKSIGKLKSNFHCNLSILQK